VRAAKLPEPFVFFIDECLGASVIKTALIAECRDRETVKTLPQGTLDEVWLPQAGKEGWVCFSKDRRMTIRPNELSALLETQVGLFTVGAGSGADHARLIVRTLPIVRRAARLLHRAFVARIDPGGALVVSIRDGKKLANATRIEPNMHEWPRCDLPQPGKKPGPKQR